MEEPIILAAEFNNTFMNSVQKITQLFPPPVCKYKSSSHTQPVFSIDEISQSEVNNIISAFNNSSEE